MNKNDNQIIQLSKLESIIETTEFDEYSEGIVKYFSKLLMVETHESNKAWLRLHALKDCLTLIC